MIAELRAHAAHLCLKKLDPGGRFTRDECQAVADLVSDLRPFENRQTLLQQGSLYSCTVFVVRGLICRSKETRNGRRQIISILIPGDIADGCTAALTRLDHSVVTLTPGYAAYVPWRTLRALESREPKLGLALRRSQAEEAAVTREWVFNVGARPATGRLSHLLCELMWRFRRVDLASDGQCDLALTQSDLADATGLSPVHVNRVLQELRKANLIRLRSGKLEVLDPERLQARAEFTPDYLSDMPSWSSVGRDELAEMNHG